MMVGRQLPFFSLLVPFWLIWAFAGRRAMWEIWPAILVTGASFAIMQFLVSNYIGPELVDIIAAVVSMSCLVGFLRVWQPKTIWTSVSLKGHENDGGQAQPARAITQHSRAGSCVDTLGYFDRFHIYLGFATSQGLAEQHFCA